MRSIGGGGLPRVSPAPPPERTLRSPDGRRAPPLEEPKGKAAQQKQVEELAREAAELRVRLGLPRLEGAAVEGYAPGPAGRACLFSEGRGGV